MTTNNKINILTLFTCPNCNTYGGFKQSIHHLGYTCDKCKCIVSLIDFELALNNNIDLQRAAQILN